MSEQVNADPLTPIAQQCYEELHSEEFKGHGPRKAVAIAIIFNALAKANQLGLREAEVDNYWAEIIQSVTEEDGVTKAEAVRRELIDYHMVMEFAAIVYDHATGGRVSKLNTLPQAVCAVIDDYVNEIVAENIADHVSERIEDLESKVGEIAANLRLRHFYRRIEDMSPDGRLTVFVEDDGDIIVTVDGPSADVDPTLTRSIASVQFCVPGSGGGKSPHTLAALRNGLQIPIAQSQGGARPHSVARRRHPVHRVQDPDRTGVEATREVPSGFARSRFRGTGDR
jgi:hypothetical protein